MVIFQWELIRREKVEEFFAQERPEYVFLVAAKVAGILANSTYPASFIYNNFSTLVHKYNNVFFLLCYAASRCGLVSWLFILHKRRLRSLQVNFHSNGFAISW